MRHSIVCAALCNVLLLIPGCGSAPIEQPISAVTHTQVVETNIAVPVPCVTTVPAPPAFLTDMNLLAAPNGTAVDRIWRDHLQRKQWEEKLNAQLIACAGGGASK